MNIKKEEREEGKSVIKRGVKKYEESRTGGDKRGRKRRRYKKKIRLLRKESTKEVGRLGRKELTGQRIEAKS